MKYFIFYFSFFIFFSGEWNSIQSEHFLLSYKKEDERSAREILLYAEEELPPIAAHLGIVPTPSEKIRIILSSTQDDFDQFTRQGVPDWGIGCALPHEKTIVLKTPRLVGKNIDLRSLIAHEISHILLHNPHTSFNKGGMGIPRWFDEGLAMFESREWKVGESMTLAWAVLNNTLLPLSSLKTHFPASEKKARLAYTQSFSTIAYIIEEFGEEGLQFLLKTLTSTGDFEKALEEGLGLTCDQFQQQWLTHLKKNYNLLFILSDAGILWGAISLLFLYALIVKTIKTRRRKRELEDDNATGNW
ncbi:hypothetical protein IIA15_05275 [candidate division TA06 bacterium]|nr:hypothetical protein [candidate division TA06 bacterium]